MLDSKRKECARTSLAVTMILSIFFALLLIYFPIPIKNSMESRVDNVAIIKQNEEDRWGKIPGTLGYTYMRNLQLYLYGAMNPTVTNYDFTLDRKFEGNEYQHTESIINYNENTTFQGQDLTKLNDTKIYTFNHAGLNVWEQLKNRPTFLNAFKAFNEFKNLYKKSDPYGRYFAHNIHLLAYSDLIILQGSVF